MTDEEGKALVPGDEVIHRLYPGRHFLVIGTYTPPVRADLALYGGHVVIEGTRSGTSLRSFRARVWSLTLVNSVSDLVVGPDDGV